VAPSAVKRLFSALPSDELAERGASQRVLSCAELLKFPIARD
jgi:hypothetical protein